MAPARWEMMWAQRSRALRGLGSEERTVRGQQLSDLLGLLGIPALLLLGDGAAARIKSGRFLALLRKGGAEEPLQP